MVKIGIICEGETEQVLFLSEKFKQILASKQIILLNVIDAKGSGNLLPHNIIQYLQILETQGAEKILIITDLDNDKCITLTKQRVAVRPQDIVIIAVRQIEAWFLACTETMRKFLNHDTFEFASPEDESQPFETINQLLVANTGRGVGKKASGKVKLVTYLLNAGLDIFQAASHPNCPSATYFINKLNTASQQTGLHHE